jgi:hypothetical protein
MICVTSQKRLIGFDDSARTTHDDVIALFESDDSTSVRRAWLRPPMTPLQTTVLMKTDIVGSTPRFRALLAADL